MRQTLRDRRASLPSDRATRSSAAAAELLVQTAEFVQAQRIAGYIAVRGEADPHAALKTALADDKAIYLPRITEHTGLVFQPWHPGATLCNNRFGIPEPEASEPAVPADTLDLVIVPLVAFDAEGTRIGSGAGYYDRAFAFRRTTARPLLAGFAYAFQECPHLPRADWDVPLDLVVTEHGIQRFSAGTRP
ncbi:MAG: 5-formyltetrahydrofolate cyclo-ligase [Gammaproteobacteria bacterium]